MRHLAYVVPVALLALAGCQPAADSTPENVRIEPGADAQDRVQEALLTAEPGSVIEFAPGRFEFSGTLSLDVDNVTLRGAGKDETFFDFAAQEAGTGGEGLMVTSDQFTIENLTVQNTKSDGIKVEGTTGATFRAVRVDWSGPPRTENGAYGIYPVQVRDVLIEGSEVRGASDAGIYVGQSENIIVRNNKVSENVAGIEIENSYGADVYDNVATNNSGGLLVFSLPELPVKNGHSARIFRNHVYDNNHPNFGLEGNIIASLPSGTGLQILANENVEVFENTVENNQTYNLAILSFLVTEREYDDPQYDPYAEGVWIHDNTFAGGGQNPQGRAKRTAEAIGGTYPDIVYDGFTNPERLVDGEVPPDAGIYIENNGDADFVNLDLGKTLTGGTPEPKTDISAHSGKLPNPPAEISLGAAT